MSIVPVRQPVPPRDAIVPLTVEQYHRMIEHGILPEGEPIELLEGQLVEKDRSATGEDPMTVGHGHSWVVTELEGLGAKLRRLGCHIRIQQPISVPPLNEPEPDAAVVIGSNAMYRKRHPNAADVLCVIEVAESSLQRDRTLKLRIYAGARIARYVIINLFDRSVEVYTEPSGKGASARYGQMETLTPGQSLELPAPRGRRLVVPVRNLLP
jgi:Uma2 family endonuclease